MDISDDIINPNSPVVYLYIATRYIKLDTQYNSFCSCSLRQSLVVPDLVDEQGSHTGPCPSPQRVHHLEPLISYKKRVSLFRK